VEFIANCRFYWEHQWMVRVGDTKKMEIEKDTLKSREKIQYSTPKLIAFGSIAHATQANMKTDAVDNIAGPMEMVGTGSS
jgi:hypothetical protein